ncbi:MAG: cytochrome C oxidase subunit IV family protein [Planctomycetota bacterium]|nr:cytochrome C oxidase subunit IV family protein [Planctomycetota bacterium]
MANATGPASIDHAAPAGCHCELARSATAGERHIPLSWLLGVWVALLLLTALTVAVSRVDLGGYNTWVAMGIATVKAMLVLAFFMHMIHERLTNFVVLCMALLFVFLFIGLVLVDTHLYRPDLIPDYAPDLRR